VVLVNVTLWLLCTRLGTLALCGRLCLSGEFPYVRRFADMPVERREEALKGWTRARWLIPVKIAFAIVKIICLNVFYTTVRTC
jgi:long-chain-alcohol oxidase